MFPLLPLPRRDGFTAMLCTWDLVDGRSPEHACLRFLLSHRQGQRMQYLCNVQCRGNTRSCRCNSSATWRYTHITALRSGSTVCAHTHCYYHCVGLGPSTSATTWAQLLVPLKRAPSARSNPVPLAPQLSPASELTSNSATLICKGTPHASRASDKAEGARGAQKEAMVLVVLNMEQRPGTRGQGQLM